MSCNVLLINLPGERIYLRDQYCSHSSKAGYYWGPYDLMIQSGIISDNFDTEVIDAIGEKLSIDQTLSRIKESYPQFIIALASASSIKEDLLFLEKCKEETGANLIVMGDIFYSYPQEMLKHSFIDAVCLQYPTLELVDYINGVRPLNNMAYRENGRIIIGEKKLSKNIIYPIPAYSKFPLTRYRFPFMRDAVCALVPTTFGCPNKCSYCPSCNINYSERNFDHIIEELQELKRQGVSNIWFRDFTFTANVERSKLLCQKMIDLKLDLKWFCMTRSDALDKELVVLMRQAGCYLILFGLETTDGSILKQENRPSDTIESMDIFSECKEAGIKVLATIIIGLPGDNFKSIRKTISDINRSSIDYLSVNIFSPRCNTKYFESFIEKFDVETMPAIVDSNRCTEAFGTITAPQLRALRLYCYFRFYLKDFKLFKFAAELLMPKLLWKYFS